MRTPVRQVGSAGARPGLSVVEVLVAMVIVSAGLLGIAGTSSLSLRMATTAARERRALQRLGDRLAQLAAGPCDRAGGVRDDPLDGIREQWTVGAPARGIAAVQASVQWQDGGRRRTFLLESAIVC